MSHQFYITLPSDSSMKYYPDNTVAKFVTKLPEPIKLEGEYEVGLAEIIYPYTWYNINNINGDFWVAIGVSQGDVKFPILKKCVIETSNYNNVDEFIKHLNAQMKGAFDGVKNLNPVFNYNNGIRKIEFKIQRIRHPLDGPDNRVFLISTPFKRRLGIIQSWHAMGGNQLYTAEEEFNLNDYLNLMYAYCDVASFMCVGDTKAPLLRVINMNVHDGQAIRLSFPDIHYVPVQKRQFETIDIRINTARGRLVPFETGRSVVILHFKRIYNLFQK